MLPGGIVLVGGGAKLPKIVDFVKKELKLPVKIGTPQGITSLQSDVTFLGAMGLIGVGEGEFQGKGTKHEMLSQFFSKLKKVFKVFIP